MEQEAIWTVAIQGDKFGPYTEAEIRRYVASNNIPRDAHVWQEGWTDWKPIIQAFNLPPLPSPPQKEQLRLNPEAVEQIRRHKRGILSCCGCLTALIVLSMVISFVEGCSERSRRDRVAVYSSETVPEATPEPKPVPKPAPTSVTTVPKEKPGYDMKPYRNGYLIGYAIGQIDKDFTYLTKNEQQMKIDLSLLQYEKSSGNQSTDWRIGYGLGYSMAAKGLPRTVGPHDYEQ